MGKVTKFHNTDSATRSLSVNGASTDPTLVVGQEDCQIFVAQIVKFPGITRYLRGHSSSVEAVSLSPDGRTLWSGAADGEVRLWPLDGGHPATRQVLQEFHLTTPVLSSSGRRIAVVTPAQALEVRDFADGMVTHSFSFSDDLTDVPLCFTADERSLALVTRGNVLRLVGLEGESWELVLDEGLGALELALSGDGVLLAVSGKRQVVLVDVPRRIVIGSLPHPDMVAGIVFRGQRELITSGHDGAIRIWDAAAGRLLRTLPFGARNLWQVRLSSDGRRLAVRGFRQVVVMDLETGTVVANLPQTSERGDVAFLAGGRTLVTLDDHTERLWNTATWEFVGGFSQIEKVAVSADGYQMVNLSIDRLVLLDATPSKKGELLRGQE